MNRQQFLLTFLTVPFASKLLAETSTDIAILTGKKPPVLRHGLQPPASKSYEAMKKEARKKGIQLHITSAYRSYERQLLIWNGKYDRYSTKGLKGLELIKKITEFSAMPGTSRHHWGTDADVFDLSVKQPKNPLSPNHYVSNEGTYNKLYEWMSKNANRFDFYEAYTNDSARSGYEFEPWHYSYQPLAVDYLASYNKLVRLKDTQTVELKGKKLIDETFFKQYIADYVNGINNKLK
jgi:LAS superfamily LD-carboxypeptidase LdcB